MIRALLSAFAARGMSTIVALVCGAITIRLYGRYLTPSELGSVAIPLQALTYLPLVDLGFRMVVNRHLLMAADKPERIQLVRFGQQFNGLMLFAAPIVAVIVLSLAGLLRNSLGNTSSVTLYACIGMGAGISVAVLSQASLLVGLGKQSLSFMLSSFGSILNLLSLWLAFRAGCRLWSLPISLAGGSILVFPVIIFCLSRQLPVRDLIPLDVSRFSDFFSRYRTEAFACLRSQISIILLFSADVILASLLFPAAQVGIYLILTRIFAYGRSFLQIPSEISWPFLARNSERAVEWTLRLLNANSWFQGCTYAVMATALPDVIHWYLGPKWQPPQALLFLMSVRFLLIGTTTPASYYLASKGAFTIINRNVLREMLVGSAAGLGLGIRFGLVGFVTGFVLSPLAGTALPMLAKIATDSAGRLSQIVGNIWLRAALAFSVPAGCAYWLRAANPSLNITVYILTPTLVGVLVVLCFIALRIIFSKSIFPPSESLQSSPILRFTRWL
jgi:O-antigen/teichoic acid export membrane protein